MFRMRYFSVFLILLVITTPVVGRVLSVAESINKAGQQRMLSQRISKNYLLITHRINTRDAISELDQSIATFEENLFNLRETVIVDSIKQKLTTLEKEWQDFRQFVMDKRSKDHSAKVLSMNNQLLAAAHDLVLALEKSSGKQSAQLINVSGRQRMLSQRIAFYYVASYVGYREDSTHQAFKIAVAEFDEGLTFLMKSKVNTKEINEGLERVQRQWVFYQNKLKGLGEAAYIPRVIRVITEAFLVDMDKITKQYEATLT